MLGNHFAYPVYLLVLAFFIDRKELIFLFVLILISWGINELLKLEFSISRPPDELHLISVIGYGFPSGHAQMSLVFWGWISRRFGILVPCVLLIILIGISNLCRRTLSQSSFGRMGYRFYNFDGMEFSGKKEFSLNQDFLSIANFSSIRRTRSWLSLFG